MTNAEARRFADVAADLGIDAEINPTYSGVGMFGEQTTGVEVSSRLDADKIETAIRIATGRCDRYRTDSMGRDVIVY